MSMKVLLFGAQEYINLLKRALQSFFSSPFAYKCLSLCHDFSKQSKTAFSIILGLQLSAGISLFLSSPSLPSVHVHRVALLWHLGKWGVCRDSSFQSQLQALVESRQKQFCSYCFYRFAQDLKITLRNECFQNVIKTCKGRKVVTNILLNTE